MTKLYLIKDVFARQEVGRLRAESYTDAIAKMRKEGWIGCFVTASPK